MFPGTSATVPNVGIIVLPHAAPVRLGKNEGIFTEKYMPHADILQPGQ